MHYIYSIRNKINGKIYIGQTKNLKNRWAAHAAYAKNPEQTGQYIHRAMAKHGIQNFEYEVLATCRTREDADEVEKFIISQYRSREIGLGYNVKPGGATAGHSESTKIKLREATIRQIAEKGHPAAGTKRTDEQRRNMSYVQQNERKNNYTPEIRKRMSEYHLGKTQDQAQIQKRISSVAEVTRLRHEAETKEGKWKCHAPDCSVSGHGVCEYLTYNDLRYCPKHGSRLKRNGTLELMRRTGTK